MLDKENDKKVKITQYEDKMRMKKRVKQKKITLAKKINEECDGEFDIWSRFTVGLQRIVFTHFLLTTRHPVFVLCEVPIMRTDIFFSPMEC